MPKAISIDLRQRVLDYVLSGHSARAAARYYSVSESFAIKLVRRWKETGSIEPSPMGYGPGKGKLAPYTDYLIGQVTAYPDITMNDLAALLQRDHNIEVAPASLSRLLRRKGLRYKKNSGRH